MLNVSLPLWTGIFTWRSVLTTIPCITKEKKNLRSYFQVCWEHSGRLAGVRFKWAVLGIGWWHRRGLAVTEGGDRVFLLVEKANAQSRLPSVGTKPPKKGQEGASFRVLGGWVPSSEHWLKGLWADLRKPREAGRYLPILGVLEPSNFPSSCE